MTYITFRWKYGSRHCYWLSGISVGRHVRWENTMGASSIGRVKALSAVMGVAAAVMMDAMCFTHGSDVTGASLASRPPP